MKTKNDVSSDYMERLKELHGSKVYPKMNHILITGDRKIFSIGSVISEKLEEASQFNDVTSYAGDIRDPIDTLNFDMYNALIVCHGVMHLDWFEETPDDLFQTIFDVNVVGTMRLVKAFVKATLHRPNKKRIIIIGSMGYRVVLNGSAAYCASKAALAQLVRCLAWELGPKAYDVFAIHPSNTVNAPMSEDTIHGLMRYRNLTRAEAEGYWNTGTFRKSPLTAEEIAAVVINLFSPSSGYLSGCQLELAGGAR